MQRHPFMNVLVKTCIYHSRQVVDKMHQDFSKIHNLSLLKSTLARNKSKALDLLQARRGVFGGAGAPLRSGSAPLRRLQKVDQPDHFFYSHADAMSPQC